MTRLEKRVPHQIRNKGFSEDVGGGGYQILSEIEDTGRKKSLGAEGK